MTPGLKYVKVSCLTVPYVIFIKKSQFLEEVVGLVTSLFFFSQGYVPIKKTEVNVSTIRNFNVF